MKQKYTVLIAEDETEIGKALTEIVNRHPGFRVVHYAMDGREALDWILNHPLPDVLITDIRMPTMDGLELLSTLQKGRHSMLTVIISGYNSFDYARQAIKFGVHDYLLKPILPEDCMSMLDSLAQALDKTHSSTFDLSLALNRRGASFPAHDAPLFLMAACLGPFPFSTRTIAPDERALQALAAPPRQMDGLPAFGMRGGIHYMLFEAKDAADAKRLFLKVVDAARDGAVGVTSMAFALSRPLEQGDIFSVAGNLLNRLRASSRIDEVVVADMGQPDSAIPSDSPLTMLFDVSAGMADSIRYRDYSAFEELLRDKLSLWRSQRQPLSTLLDYVKFQYAYTVQQLFSAAAAEVVPAPFGWEERLDEIFTTAKNWEGLCAEIFNAFSDLFNSFQNIHASRHMMREVAEYIEQNYEEHITNQSLARHFGFVPSYISRMFREYKGISPCDYLTYVRIQNAQRIIRESGPANFQEIALAVGFSDSSYFSKQFKKQVGMTPSEYRASCLSGQEVE